jgi:hypothetical protein
MSNVGMIKKYETIRHNPEFKNHIGYRVIYIHRNDINLFWLSCRNGRKTHSSNAGDCSLRNHSESTDNSSSRWNIAAVAEGAQIK